MLRKFANSPLLWVSSDTAPVYKYVWKYNLSTKSKPAKASDPKWTHLSEGFLNPWNLFIGMTKQSQTGMPECRTSNFSWEEKPGKKTPWRHTSSRAVVLLKGDCDKLRTKMTLFRTLTTRTTREERQEQIRYSIQANERKKKRRRKSSSSKEWMKR